MGVVLFFFLLPWRSNFVHLTDTLTLTHAHKHCPLLCFFLTFLQLSYLTPTPSFLLFSALVAPRSLLCRPSKHQRTLFLISIYLFSSSAGLLNSNNHHLVYSNTIYYRNSFSCTLNHNTQPTPTHNLLQHKTYSSNTAAGEQRQQY